MTHCQETSWRSPYAFWSNSWQRPKLAVKSSTLTLLILLIHLKISVKLLRLFRYHSRYGVIFYLFYFNVWKTKKTFSFLSESTPITGYLIADAPAAFGCVFLIVSWIKKPSKSPSSLLLLNIRNAIFTLFFTKSKFKTLITWAIFLAQACTMSHWKEQIWGILLLPVARQHRTCVSGFLINKNTASLRAPNCQL